MVWAAVTRLRSLGDRLWRTAATRGGLIFVLAGISVSLSNFVFHLILSRLLGPVHYGVLGALVNVTTVATVPLSAIQVTVAQSIASRPDPAATPPLGRLLRIAAVVSIVALALWIAATPTLDRFFHLHSPTATIVLGVWLVPSVLNSTLEGVLLGQRRFRVVAIGQLVGGAAVRLLSGVVLVEAGFGVTGGVLATVLASAAVLLVYAAALRRVLLASGRFVPRAGDALLSTLSLGGAALLTTLDAWLGRHFLPARSAGLFVAAATAGNIALFLPMPITLVYFPRLAATRGLGHGARQALARSIALVAVLALTAAGVMALVPGLVVSLLFGPAFAGASVALGTVAVADAGIAIASCFVYYQVARRSRIAVAPWFACVLAVVLAAVFHGSIEVLAIDMAVACWSLVTVLALPTALAALRTLADDTASLPRQAILLEEPAVDLSVVVPFYNVGAERLLAHLVGVVGTLQASGATFEVLPVSDGSTDGSDAALRRLIEQLPGVSRDVVRPIAFADNRGKGEALRAGLSHGRGRYLGFIDGDGDIPSEGLARFVALARTEQPDVLVGSKRHPEADVQYPPLRRLYSAGYQLVTRVLFGLRVRDTQTGIKLVRRDVLAEVLPRMVEKRFAFDLELLAIAARLGYWHVAELPVTIGERFPSTISVSGVWRMLQDTLAVFWRLRLLGFYDPPLVEAGAAPAVGVDLVDRLAAGERLRILVCHWRDVAHPEAAAAELQTLGVARAWVADGHRVTWFAGAVAGRPSVERVDGITVVRRGGRRSVFRQARTFWDRQGRGRFDLVLDQVEPRPFEAVRWAGGPPVVAFDHGTASGGSSPVPQGLLARIGRYFVEPRRFRWLRQVPTLTTSESSRTSLLMLGLDDVVVVPAAVVPAAIDAIEGPAAGDEPVVLAGTASAMPSATAILQTAVRALDVDRELEAVGEDVTVAWRRLLRPVSAFCERRAWSVAGIAALVAIAPLSEMAMARAVSVVADVALGCFAVATVGFWADAMQRRPPSRRGRSSGLSQLDRRNPHTAQAVLAVGVLAAAAIQVWLGSPVIGPGRSTPIEGTTWLHRLHGAFAAGAGVHVIAAALQLPIDASATVLHGVGLPASADARLWISLLFAAVTMAMTWMLLALGLGVAAAVTGGALYAFSPYLMAMSGFDVTYLAAMALVPGIVAWVVTIVDRGLSTRRLAWAVPGALLAGLAAGSPSLLLACLVAVPGSLLLVGWIRGTGQLGVITRRVGGGLLAAAAMSLYWLVPYVEAIVTGDLVTEAAHRRWQWASVHATVAHAFWLNTAFDWTNPTVFPYAGDFHRFPLVLLRYAVPIVAFSALGVVAVTGIRSAQVRMRVVIVASAVALVVITISTGSNTPGAPIFGLLRALPLGWLFEDPGRFLFVVGGSYSVLVAALIDQVVAQSQGGRSNRSIEASGRSVGAPAPAMAASAPTPDVDVVARPASLTGNSMHPHVDRHMDNC